MTGGIWAAVPVKLTTGSKQRLAAVLDPAQRRLLALTMLEDVLAALCAAPSLAGVAVVTIDPDAAVLGSRYGARIIATDATDGHTAAVLGAGQVLRADGCAGMLSLPGDIPLVTPDEIETLMAAHGSAPAFTIVPSHDQRGSNAILASPPGIVPLRYGDDSYHPHLAAARQAGVACRSLHLRGIALDIDHPEDLTAFLAIPSETRTSRFLLSLP